MNDIIVQFAILWGMRLGDGLLNRHDDYFMQDEMKQYDSQEVMKILTEWAEEYQNGDNEDTVEFFDEKVRCLIFHNLRNLAKVSGFEEIICTSFEEAKNNNRRKNIVIIDNTEIYLTYKYEGQFGEFVCWVEDEFKEDETVYSSVRNWIYDIYSRLEKDIDARVKSGAFPFDFKPYD